MRTLRIAFVAHGNFWHVGPYIQFFRDRGHDVHWIAYGRPTMEFGCPAHVIVAAAPSGASLSKWRYVTGALAARRLLRELRPDVVHGHYVTSAGVICLLSGFRPYVLTAHGSDVIHSMRSPLWRAVLRRVFAGAAMVNVVSDGLGGLARGLGVSDERLLVATLGVDARMFDYREPRPACEPIRLVCTRMLDDVYDPWTVLRACEILRQRGVPFEMTFAAGGPRDEAVRRESRARGLQDTVRFLGGYRNEDLPAILHSSDLFLSASLWDGTSISLLEAMACGVVPVVSRIESNLAWLEDGRTALMFDRGDARGLASQIERAAGDAALRVRAARQNREVVEARADRRKNMLLLEDRFFRILGSHRP